MTAAAPAGFVEIEELARVCRSPGLTEHDRYCAGSLVRAWSDQATAGPRATPISLSRRQWAMAGVLIRKSGATPRSSTSPYILVKAAESRWWFDTSPHRQACRGRKSGMTRRYATRDRDARISRWVNRGRYSVRSVRAPCRPVRRRHFGHCQPSTGRGWVLARTGAVSPARHPAPAGVQRAIFENTKGSHPCPARFAQHRDIHLVVGMDGLEGGAAVAR